MSNEPTLATTKHEPNNPLAILSPDSLNFITGSPDPNKPRDKERKRLPEWIRTQLPTGDARARFESTTLATAGNSLHTVCEEARCPNIHDCWGRGTATFMIAGQTCTRGCRFCSVETVKNPDPLEVDEPARLAHAIKTMRLDYAVITVVNRDDRPDGGAAHYRACVDTVRRENPQTLVELLCSDLSGNLAALESLLCDPPIDLAVFAHNVECVPRLDAIVRDPRANFRQSLTILHHAKTLRPDLVTKTSLMVGLGETDAEVEEAMRLMRSVNVDLLTIGQYLQPTMKHLVVDRFVRPEQFERWSVLAQDLGFTGCAAGPMVRSSFKAETLYDQTIRLRAAR